MRALRWLPLGAVVFLAGCAAQSASDLAPPRAETRQDAFLPYQEIATSSFEVIQPGGDRVRGHLAARRDRATGALTTHAILGVVYVQRLGRRYEAARNESAESLPFRQLHHEGANCRRQAGCVHAELFQVDIPEAGLRRARAASAGYPVKMFGRAGHTTLFPIPKELVAALLDEIDRRPTPVARAR